MTKLSTKNIVILLLILITVVVSLVAKPLLAEFMDSEMAISSGVFLVAIAVLYCSEFVARKYIFKSNKFWWKE